MNSTSTVVATVASVIVVGLLCSTLRVSGGQQAPGDLPGRLSE
jgi:hypothetical protein